MVIKENLNPTCNISIFQRKMCGRTELLEVKLGQWLGKLVAFPFIYASMYLNF